jgi:TP901 family phage tail tape measure protein
MPDQIVNTIGYDVSQAITALRQITEATNIYNKSVVGLGKSLRQNNNIQPNFKPIQSDLRRTTQGVEHLTVSWGLLARIVTTQLTVSAFGKFRRELAESVQDAIAFQNALARIQTIADGSLGGLQNLGIEVRKVSDQFAIPLTDVAGGLNEVISSQVSKDGAENLRFLASSAELATAGFVSTEKAVNVLAGTVNAFGLSAGDADAVASKLFRVVDLGNLTFEQLATSFNRTSAQSKQLGVSLSEQAAFFAAATNAGVTHNEAATLLSGILNGLIKPTDAMDEALRRLGFTSAETALTTLGLAKTVRGLIGTTDGSAESVAKLFQNVRGLRGALQITQGFDKFEDFLKQIDETSDSLVKLKALDVLSTEAKKFQTEATKLTNLLTVDFGQALLRTGVNISSLTGGVDSLKAVMASAAPVIGVTTAALLAYSAAAIKGSAATKALIASSAPGFLLAAGAFASGSALGDELISVIEAPRKAFDEQQTALISQMREAANERLKVQSDGDGKLIKGLLAQVQESNKLYIADGDNIERYAKLLKSRAESATADVLSSREKLVNGLRQSVSESENLISGSQGRILNLKDKQSDRSFADQTKNLADAQKVFALVSRAESLAAEAATKLKSADPKEVARGFELFQRAEQSGEAARAIAERTNNRALEFRAAQGLNSLTDKQISSEKQLQSLQANRAKGAADLAKRQSEILSGVQEQAAIIRENSNLLDKNGELLPSDQIAKRNKATADAVKKIQASGLSKAELAQFEKLGLGDAARQFNQKLAFQSIDLSFNVAKGITDVQTSLKTSFDKFKINLGFDTSSLEAALGKRFTTPDEIANGLSEAAAQAQKLRAGFEQIGTDNAEITKLRTEIIGISEQAGNADRALLRLLGVNTAPVSQTSQQVADIRAEINKLAESGKITDDQLKSVFQKVAALGDQATLGGKVANFGLGVDISELSTAIGLLKKLQQTQQEQAANPANKPGAQQTLQILNQALQAGQGLSAAVAPSQTIATNAATAANSLIAGADAWVRASQVQFRQPVQNAQFGNYFAHGGRGTDTIAAFLSPGETVVDARNSRKFFSELQAIRAGAPPAFRQGGVVNNTTQVGDINIIAHKGDSVDTIGAELQRRIRRGSLKL